MDTFVDSLSSTETLAQSSSVFTQDLSAIYWQDSAHSTLQNLLSSLRQVNEDLKAAREEIPTDPYERLKWEYCHRDAKPFDFDSIETPKDYCPQKMYQEVYQIACKFTENLAEDMKTVNLSGAIIDDIPNFGYAFAFKDEEETHGNYPRFQIDKDKITNHFMFLDMIRSIPLEYIQSNPKEFAQKILTKFTQVYK